MALARAADHDGRCTDAVERGDLCWCRLQCEDHHRVHALAEQVCGEQPTARRGVAGDVVEQQVVPLLAQQLLRAMDDGAEEPPGHVGYDDTDGASLASGEACRVRRGDVLHPRGGSQHPLTRGLGDPRQPAQSARDCRRRDPSLTRDVLDPGHLTLFLQAGPATDAHRGTEDPVTGPVRGPAARTTGRTREPRRPRGCRSMVWLSWTGPREPPTTR